MKLKVYQLDPEKDTLHYAFRSYDAVMQDGGMADASQYRCVFDGTLPASEPEGMYVHLNISRPAGYIGHSLSVSDVLEMENGDTLYCDAVGFRKLENFDTAQAEPLEGCRMLALEPHREPYETVLPDHLDALQEAVGGWIECTYPFQEDVLLIGNEEAKLIGMEGNRRIGGEIYAGTLLLAGYDEEGALKSLTGRQLEQYSEQLRKPDSISPREILENMHTVIRGLDQLE